MTGHGHVTPNPDGTKARCGGPGICSSCSKELIAANGMIKRGDVVAFLRRRAIELRGRGLESAADGLAGAAGDIESDTMEPT